MFLQLVFFVLPRNCRYSFLMSSKSSFSCIPQQKSLGIVQSSRQIWNSRYELSPRNFITHFLHVHVGMKHFGGSHAAQHLRSTWNIPPAHFFLAFSQLWNILKCKVEARGHNFLKNVLKVSLTSTEVINSRKISESETWRKAPRIGRPDLDANILR